MDSLPLKRNNSLRNLNNRKATHSFAPRPLIFKLQHEVLKFNYASGSWSSPKTNLDTNFKKQKLKKQNLKNVSFSQ